jgi:hypothetical protein
MAEDHQASEVERAQVAVEDASTLRTAGDREAAVLSTAGQRRVNLIWEVTQGIIALAVTLTTLAVAAVLVLQGDKGGAPLSLLSNTFFLIVGFYFGRTNHQKTGGVVGGDSGR